jgi:hypothetical protein
MFTAIIKVQNGQADQQEMETNELGLNLQYKEQCIRSKVGIARAQCVSAPLLPAVPIKRHHIRNSGMCVSLICDHTPQKT